MRIGIGDVVLHVPSGAAIGRGPTRECLRLARGIRRAGASRRMNISAALAPSAGARTDSARR